MKSVSFGVSGSPHNVTPAAANAPAALPKTSTGKIQKNVLREQAASK